MLGASNAGYMVRQTVIYAYYQIYNALNYQSDKLYQNVVNEIYVDRKYIWVAIKKMWDGNRYGCEYYVIASVCACKYIYNWCKYITRLAGSMLFKLPSSSEYKYPSFNVHMKTIMILTALNIRGAVILFVFG